MEKTKNNKLCNKIRSVKSWLSKAEASFGNENELQGELNLLLAEAELQHLRETDAKKAQKRRHIISMGVAFIIAAAFIGVWKMYPAKTNNVDVEISKINIQSPVVEKISSEFRKTMPKLENEQIIQTQQVKIDDLPIKTNTAQNQNIMVKSKSDFTNDEMKSLVRTAGKVLRSNT